MTIRNCSTCQADIEACRTCFGLNYPNWKGKEVEQPQDPLRAEVDRLKALLDETYADADDVLRPRIAELEAKLSLYDNLMAELKDEWYRRGIAGFQEAIKAEREACAKVCDDLAGPFNSHRIEEVAAAIRARK
jgi:hypothetical protein